MVNSVPLAEKTLLTPLDPVALLGVLVRMKLLKFVGANVAVVCALAERVSARAMEMLRKLRVIFIRDVRLYFSVVINDCGAALALRGHSVALASPDRYGSADELFSVATHAVTPAE
jgi:hypothetical protein